MAKSKSPDHLPQKVQESLEALHGRLTDWCDRLSEVTRNLCYDAIHPSQRGDHDANEAEFEKLRRQHFPTFDEPFEFTNRRYGANLHFIVRAWFRAFVAGVSIALSPSRSDDDHPPPFKPILTSLLEIAKPQGLGTPWVRKQALGLIQRHSHWASDWIRMACHGPDAKPIDQWQAPMLFATKPGEYDPDGPDLDRQLMPMSVERSRAILKAAENKFLLTPTNDIERDIRNAILDAETAPPKPAPQPKVNDGAVGKGQAQVLIRLEREAWLRVSAKIDRKEKITREEAETFWRVGPREVRRWSSQGHLKLTPTERHFTGESASQWRDEHPPKRRAKRDDPAQVKQRRES